MAPVVILICYSILDITTFLDFDKLNLFHTHFKKSRYKWLSDINWSIFFEDMVCLPPWVYFYFYSENVQNTYFHHTTSPVFIYQISNNDISSNPLLLMLDFKIHSGNRSDRNMFLILLICSNLLYIYPEVNLVDIGPSFY